MKLLTSREQHHQAAMMMKKFNASFFRYQQVFGLNFSVFSPLKTVNQASRDV